MSNKRFYLALSGLIITVVFTGFLIASCTGAVQFFIPDNKALFTSFSGVDKRIVHQSFITPDDAAVKDLASGLNSTEDAYKLSVSWIYIREQWLNGTEEKWLKPAEFLTGTPDYPDNPVPGRAVSDCEEQACTLVSLIRAMNVPADEVRVVLGTTGRDDDFRGHAWVELWDNGGWLPLDPSCGSYWDDVSEVLVESQGLPFNFYADYEYPVPNADTYFNDIYYLDATGGSGNAPNWWFDTLKTSGRAALNRQP